MPKDTFFNLSQEKQERIIESAKTAFSKKRYSAVTIDAIVALAKIPKGSFYQYFDNKDDLYKYIFYDVGKDKKEMLLEALDQYGELDFSKMLMQLMNKAYEFEARDRRIFELKQRFLNEVPQETKNIILSELVPATMDLYKQIILKYIQNTTFREDIDVETAAFILTMVTMHIDQYPSATEVDHSNTLLKVCKILEKGLVK
ncbi:TetR/AcrR family transcriptional regulator [Vallitaleaceae bacterium 9-2]